MRIHVKDPGAPAAMERFAAQWTPTTLVLDPDGRERHRIEGFLPPDDFLAQLRLGLGQLAMSSSRFIDAEREFDQVVKELPDSDAAPEAQYWRGVSKYKGTNDAAALKETADAFKKRYGDSTWAKKASIWN